MAPQWPKIIAILGCNVYNFQFHSISVRTTKSFEFTASPTHEILDLKYEPIEQISTVSSMFPVSQNFSTYSEYREKAISWYEKTQRAARKLALPLPVWSTVNYPFKPFINPKLKYRIPTGYLGPENHLQLEAIIINKEPFDESSVFGEKGRFQKDVPIKDHISLGKSTLIPPEPDPEYYDDYESYLQAVNNWTQICSNCTLIPHHPSEFKEKDCPELEPNPNSGHSLPPEFQYDYDSIYQPDLESTCSRQKFIRGPSSGKLKLKKTKVKNRSKTFKVKTKIVKKKVKIAKPKTFSKKMVKVISKLFKALQRADYNQQTPIAPHKMTFPYISFPFYPGNLLSTMQSHGNDSLDTKSYSILRVFKLVAYSFNAASQYGFISNFEFKTFPSFNEIIHALNYAYSSSSSFYSLYMFYFLFHVFDTNPTISKMLISNTSSMYVTLRILIRFSHVSDCIYDPMVGKFNELSKEENDPMYELFYQSLTGVYTTKVLKKTLVQLIRRNEVISDIIETNYMTSTEGLSNLLSNEFSMLFVNWMYKISEKEPIFLATLFLYLLSSDITNLESFFMCFNTNNRSIFKLFKLISEADLNMFYTITILTIYNKTNALIIYKMLEKRENCKALFDCLNEPLINFVSSLFNIKVEVYSLPLDSIFYMIELIPNLSQNNNITNLLQSLLLSSLNNLMIRTLNNPILLRRQSKDLTYLNRTLIITGNMFKESFESKTLYIILESIQLITKQLNNNSLINDNEIMKLLFICMISDSDLISSSAWKLFATSLTLSKFEMQNFVHQENYMQKFEDTLRKITPMHFLPFVEALGKIVKADAKQNDILLFMKTVNKCIDCQMVYKTLVNLMKDNRIVYRNDYLQKFRKMMKTHKELFKTT